ERHFKTKEGEILLADVRLVREEDEAKRLLHFSAVVQDITARRLSEGMLRVYERALAATQNGIVITDARKADHPIAYVNPAYLEITGYSAEELIGRNPRLLNARARDQTALGELRRAVQQGEECTVLVRNHRKNGEAFWNQLAIAPVRDAGGTLTHFIGLVMDATESVATAAERDDQLEAAEANNEAKDRFLSVLSHELRSPLNAILAWTSILREQGGGVEGRAIDAIESAAKSQARLVDDLLDASRIRKGTLEIVPANIELGAVVRRAVDQLLPIAVARGVTLQMRAPERALEVLLDPERITQIVRNLVDNALKFTPKGGEVEVSVEGEGERFAIEVRDNGRGIAPSELPFVFDAFWRGEGKNRAHGLGLGLAIVRHLVERQGGRVSALSEGQGRGATFRLAFSKRETMEAARREESPREPLPTGVEGLEGLEIVIAEDDVATLEATAAAMRRAGAVPRLAQSVSEALRLFEASLPDVLVSDIDLPDRDGLDLIRNVRAMGEPRASLLAVAVTGLADPADRRRIQRAGYDACLAKPIVPQLVAERVASLLAQLRASSAARPRRALVAGDDARAVDALAAALRSLEQHVSIAPDATTLLWQASADPPDLIFLCVPLRGLDTDAFGERVRAKERRAVLIGVVPDGDAREQSAFDFVLQHPVAIGALQRKLRLNA
ncbi:MAG TPA: ATP-binding protein, partial [Myxococcota bacterium]|nr:ATP-binding protein [Myxococcota bacterium]